MRPILAIIVIAQFFCTSLWFAGNAVIGDIMDDLHLNTSFLGNLTSAVQFGFISGTLVFALLTIADRFPPSSVFFFSSIFAGLFNLGITLPNIQESDVLLYRFLTGFFLAGIYPVGMKIASDYFQAGLGKSLGFLVGALVLGTALPHLLKNFTLHLPWKYVLYTTTTLSIIGGLSIYLLVPNGPFRKHGQKLKLSAFLSGFSIPSFRAFSFGYFGHMWELYTFWAMVPVMLSTYKNTYPQVQINIPLLSFLIIATGGPACVASGILSQKYGAKKIATFALTVSCICCLLSPLLLFTPIHLSVSYFSFHLEHRCNCRLTLIFHACCAKCTRSHKGNIANHC
jgi:MFS family permease